MDANRSPSPRRALAAFLGLLQGHLELFTEEFKDQQSHLLKLGLLAGLTLVFALLLVVGLSFLILVAFWESHRLAASIGLCLFYGLGLAACAWSLYRRVEDSDSPFKASLEELARDREELLP